MIKVLVSGACGRMGQAVVKAVMEDSELQLVGAVDIVAGADAGELVGMGKSGVIVADDLAKAIDETKPEVMVDFTRPDVVYGNTHQSAIDALSVHQDSLIYKIRHTYLSSYNKFCKQDIRLVYKTYFSFYN